MSQDIQRYVKQLQSTDPQQRRQAIIALGRSGNREALPHLHRVYKSDSQEALRKLAGQAGQHLQKQLNQASASGGGASSQAYASASAQHTERPQKTVTERDRKKAKSLVDQAIDAQVRGDTDKVIAFLAEAIEVNPEMERNSTVLGLLANAMGMEANQALQRLKTENEVMAAQGLIRKRASGGDWSETVNFLLEVGIWFIIIALFGAVSIFLSIDDSFWNEARTNAAAQGTTTTDTGQAISTQEQLAFIDSAEEEFNNLGPLFAILSGIFYGFFLTATALFMSFVAWWVGITFLDGEGLLYPFLTAMLRVVIVTLLIGTAIGFISQFFDPYSDTGILLSIAPTILGIAVTAWTIGQIHGFGIAMGCVNMMGTVIACGVFGCCCPVIFSMVA
ncbi:MAG: hypothetical protein ACLFTK_04955 [Anaerolineales bacterium]